MLPPLEEAIETTAKEVAAIVSSRPRDARGGRPSKLTFARVRRILRALANGSPDAFAPAAGGIEACTWKDWCARFPQLSRLADRARNNGVNSLVSEVRNGVDIKGNPDWRPRLALLERRHKEHFAAPKATETTVNVNNNSLTLNVSGTDVLALAAAHAKATAALGLPAPLVVASLNKGLPDTTSQAQESPK